MQLCFSERSQLNLRILLVFAILFAVLGSTAAYAAPPSDPMTAGFASLKANHYDEALAAFRAAAEARSKDPRPYIMQGLALNRLGRSGEALEVLRLAEKLGATGATLNFEMGWAAVNVHDYKTALNHIEAYEKAVPGRAKNRELRGRALLGLQRFEEAQREFHAAMNQDKRLRPTSLYYLALLENERNNREKAGQYVKTLLRTAPDAHLTQSLLKRLAATVEQPESTETTARRKRLFAGAAGQETPWSLNAGISTGYNDNVIGLGDDQPLPTGISQEGSYFATAGLNAGYILKIGAGDALSARYRFIANHYFNLDNLDTDEHILSLGYGHLLSDRVALAVSAVGNNLSLDHDSFRRRFGVRPSLAFRWSKTSTSEFSYQYITDDYRFTPALAAFDRDGKTHSLALMQRCRFSDAKVVLDLALEIADHSADGSDFDYEALGLSASVSKVLDIDIGGDSVPLTLAGGVARYWNDFDHKNTLAGSGLQYSRYDYQTQVHLEAIVPFYPGVDFKSYIEVNNNTSNIGAYDFMQRIAGISVMLQF